MLSSSGPDSKEEESRSARRAEHSRLRQARLHTVGLLWPKSGGPMTSLHTGFWVIGVSSRPKIKRNGIFFKKKVYFLYFLIDFQVTLQATKSFLHPSNLIIRKKSLSMMRSRVRVTIEGQCVILQTSLQIEMFDFLLNSQNHR